MSYKQVFYPESRFGGFSDVDGTIAFYLRVNALLQPGMVVVDIGCGRGAYGEDPVAIRRDLRILKGKAGRVIGLDVDTAGAENPYLDEFRQIEGDTWPLTDACADLCLSDHVIEHLENPDQFFAEARRVLKPEGWLCLRTPNLWSYFGLLSRLVPNRSHTRVLSRVKERSHDRDVFPTVYRCNTVPAVRKILRQHGFEAVVYGFGPEPGYLSFSKAAYWTGVVYQRLFPRLLQPVIFAFARGHKNA